MLFGLLGLGALILSRASTDLMISSAQPAEAAWDIYVGQKATFVADRIREENPQIRRVILVPPGYGVTCDYDTERVFIYHDVNGRVTKRPKVG